MTRRRRPKYPRRLPVWVDRVTEVVNVDGKQYVNVVTKRGKPRTLRVR